MLARIMALALLLALGCHAEKVKVCPDCPKAPKCAVDVVNYDLPEATPESVMEHRMVIAVAISADDKYTLNGRPVGDYRSLRDALSKLEANPEHRVILAADKKASWNAVLRALDATKQAGHKFYAFAVTPVAAGEVR